MRTRFHSGLKFFSVKEWPEYASSLQHHSLFAWYSSQLVLFHEDEQYGWPHCTWKRQLWLNWNVHTKKQTVFHAVRTSSNGFQTIVIRSPDTDVTVLAVVLWSCAGSLWKDHPHICTGTKHHVHYILVFTVRQKLGEQVSNGAAFLDRV